VTFELEPIALFRFDLTAAALGRRDDNLLDRWTEETYKRMPMVDSKAVGVSLQQIGPIDIPHLQVNDRSGPDVAHCPRGEQKP